jgi:hypothetical protein
MPVELMRRPSAADNNNPPVPVAPVVDNDDWSGVFCCSAMRPRPQDPPPAPRSAPVYSADDPFFGA